MPENQSLTIVSQFVDALYRSGVRQVCISPGSRSTPLTMAFARHGAFRIWSLLDERSAGFFAVGAARATGESVALVCTSGTAVGNYLPAVMEAHNARLPLLLLTADRPPELHGVGANQTVQQQGVYGSFPCLSIQMPVPAEEPLLGQHAASVALRVAVQLARRTGPVHVNWPFREPLIPPNDEVPALPPTKRTYILPEPARPAAESMQMLADKLLVAGRGLIVAGPTQQKESASAILALAEKLRWPVVADALSGLRGIAPVQQPHVPQVVIHGFDAFLRSERVRHQLEPEIIIRFGGTPTSKALGQYLAQHAGSHQLVVDDHAEWSDPFYSATDLIACDPVAFCEGLLPLLPNDRDVSDWLDKWQELNDITEEMMARHFAADGWHEGAIYRLLLDALPANANLFVGNSMPVRDLETFYPAQNKSLTVLANRGVSGIDGVVSSAAGAAAASGRKTVLVIGDVSLYHDLNALLLPKRTGADLLVVVPNNDGGGIFSFLPPANYPDTFEHFQTAHGLTYEYAAKQFGGWYQRVESRADFLAALDAALPLPGLRVIELTFQVTDNVALHRELFTEIIEQAELICS